MKKIFNLVGITIVFSLVMLAQVQNVVSIKYPEYTLSAPLQLEESADAELVPLVVGKLDFLPEKAAKSRFGILFRDDYKNLANVNLLEILDASTGKLIKRVSLEEYFYGKEGDLKFYKEISVIEDEALPEGRKIELSFFVQSSKDLKVKIRFIGKVEGSIVKNKSGFVISNDDKLTQLKPALVFFASSQNVVQTEISKKGKQQNVVITTGTVTIQQNQKTNVLKLEIAGTNISFNRYIPVQAENINEYFIEKKTVPSIAIVTISEKPKTAPRDTMLYVIYYHNIGTAPATDVNITGPIPVGTKYLEGSAIAQIKDVEIDVDRKKAEPPQIGEVLSVKWIDKSQIKPGEVRWVRYSVVVD